MKRCMEMLYRRGLEVVASAFILNCKVGWKVQSSCVAEKQGDTDSDMSLCHKGLCKCMRIFWK